ncbi:MAG: AsmA-like C-terminal region-containing protein [Pseudomonadota bacterium]
MTYTGSARFVDGPELEGRYTATIRDAAAIAAVLSPDVTGLDAIGQTDVRGEVSLEADRLILRDTDLKTQSDALSGTLNGTFGRNGDRLTGNARFEADLADAGPTLRGFVPDLTRDADVLGAMSASGTLDLDGDRIAIDDLVTNTRSPLLTASYQGRLARTGSAVSLEGDASANVPSVTALNEALEAEIPYAESFGRVRLSASPEGEVGDLRLADLTVDMSEGAINGRFSGAAVLSETTSLSGAMEVDGPSLRAIAARNGTALPPATGDAPIFERFGLAGNVAGTLDELQLDDARLRLDALEAAGTFGINLRPERPLLTGDVRLGELDLRPYVSAYSAQRPEGALPPWSEASIPTQGLGAADARIEIAADGIRLPRIRLGQTRSTVTLENGRLEADVPQMDLYGGSGRGSFVLDGRSGEPAIAIEAGLRDLQAQSFLGAVAGFTRATGQGGTQVSLQGRGSSQAAIMRSLSGQGSFSVQDGSISGIDAAEFLNGLQSAFASRALPGGIGADKVTQFRELLGEFSMSQGVATIDDFTLDAATVAVEGSGQIDIGAQTIDIRFRPRARDRDMGGLAGFGIPLRLTGPFGAAQASLDADFLGQVLQARAAQEAQRVIGDRVGGTAGAVLGSILGAPQTVPDDPAEDGSEMPSADEAQPQDEPTIEDAVQDGLMELFGVRTREKGED